MESDSTRRTGSDAPGVNEDVVIRWDGGVLVIILNRPEVSNALNPSLLRSLSEAFAIADEERCRAVVLSGAGRNFCAGADLAAFRENPAEMALVTAFHPPLLALAALRKPVIAALNGSTAGGGLGFALAADLRIGATSTRFHPAWVRIGLAPDLGVSWMLPRMIGYSRAYEWLLQGEPMSASQALDLRLVNAIVSDDELLDTAIARARELAAKPAAATAFTKELLLSGYGREFSAQVEEEARVQGLVNAAASRSDEVKTQIAKFAKD